MERKNKIAFASLILLLLVANLFVISALTIKSVASTPEQVAPGESASISIEIENNFNEDVENVNIFLDFSSAGTPIAPHLGSAEDTIDLIEESEEKKISFGIIVLPEAVAGVYKIPVRMEYYLASNSTNLLEKESVISVVVNSLPEIRTSVEGSLVRGMENIVTLRIINDGLSDVKFASVQIEKPARETINSPLYEYLGNIDSDDFDSIEIKIFVPEDSQPQISIPVTINYKDSTNKDYTKTENLNLRTYSREDAVKLGLVPAQSYLIYIVSFLGILGYVGYRIFKRIRRKNKEK